MRMIGENVFLFCDEGIEMLLSGTHMEAEWQQVVSQSKRPLFDRRKELGLAKKGENELGRWFFEFFKKTNIMLSNLRRSGCGGNGPMSPTPLDLCQLALRIKKWWKLRYNQKLSSFFTYPLGFPTNYHSGIWVNIVLILQLIDDFEHLVPFVSFPDHLNWKRLL